MRLVLRSSVSYFRNFIFGVEDSLVSTVGLLSGVAVAGMSKETLFVTGVILILVEAISMSAGSFLSESSAQALDQRKVTGNSAIAGSVMFFSYFISGFIPLIPYMFLPIDAALRVSVVWSIGALFALGVVGAKITRVPVMANGFKMAFIGGLAIAIGILAGSMITKLQ
jgi:VIT1/CCC1 family predicted Fe2+/Mn2+ transporter